LNIHGYYNNIIELTFDNNNINKLPNQLSNNLKYLSCAYNKIEQLPILPDSLLYLCISNNNISKITLPNNILKLYCSNNKIENLDNLPQSLILLSCSYNKIKKLDNIPYLLEELYIYGNELSGENIENLKLRVNILYDLP
jgi:Leucine-rich repeat (LRR) protein